MTSPLPPALRLLLLVTTFALALPVVGRADGPPLAHIFQDNMVLQRDMPAPVWGWAAPNTDVELSFGGQTKHAKADATGYWKAVLDPLPASKENRELKARVGSATVTRKNVLVGEVWLATGQSNMVVGGPDLDTGVYPFYVSPPKPGKAEIRVQRFGSGATLEPLPAGDPAEQGDAPWTVLAENPPAKDMNIPPYFARVIRDALDVPVGIVQIAVPGTNQGAWMSKEALKAFPGEGGKPDYYETLLDKHDDKSEAGGKATYKTWAEYQQAEDAWMKTKTGKRPSGELPVMNYPTTLYNTRVFPLAPMAIRGIIWHQGEAGPGGPYGERLKAMFAQWRKLFGQDFYTIWGTLGRSTADAPPLAPVRTSFYRSVGNVEIRKAADLLKGDKKAALVEFYDIGNEGTHWTEKAEAGRRMGLAALTLAYGKPQIFSGPRLVDSKVEGGKATLRFEQAGDGLVYKPSIGGISGFYVHGKTGDPQWGQVKVVGKDTLEISSPQIADLQTVAYADNNNPHETLFNSAGLPASPFAVNPAPAHDPAPAATLLALADKASGMVLQLAHVRREGYVFQLKAGRKAPKGDKPAKESVTAFIPAEWKAYEVVSGTAKVETKESPAPGGKYITFDALSDGSWVIVAEAGKVEPFRKVNRF